MTEQQAMKLTDTTRARSSRLLIGLILAAAGLFTFLRAHFREPVQDELVYAYVLDTDRWGGYWEEDGLTRKLSTLGEIVSSQANHYRYANGRTIVHAIEQLFTGFIGTGIYNLAGAVMMMILIAAIVRLAIPGPMRRTPLWWMITAIALLYLMPYPHIIWYSVNYSCNYLIPAVLLTGVLLLMRRVNSDTPMSRLALAATAMAAFALGWSHEAFSLPAAGVVGIYYLLHFNRFRRRGWVVALPLFAGALLILLSPGNWSRVDTGSGMATSIVVKAMYLVEWIGRMPMTWVTLGVMIYGATFGRAGIMECLRREWMAVCFIALDAAFLCYIMAWSYAYTPVGLMLLVISLHILTRCKPAVNEATGQALTVGLLTIFVISQTSITLSCKTQAEYQRGMIGRFLESDDGAVVNNPPAVPLWDRPYVTTWPLFRGKQLHDMALTAEYGKYRKRFYMLSPTDYRLATGTTGGEFAEGEDNFWAEADSVASDTEFEVEYYPVDFHHNGPLPLRVKFALSPGGYPSVECVTPDTVTIGTRRFLVIRKPEIRKIRSIRPVKE